MKYFTIDELIKSSSAKRLGIDNTPDLSQTASLINLIEKVLDPLREKIGMPVIVNSGFRCRKLNTAVGGSSTSQHMKGQAADIQTAGDKFNKNLYDLAKTLDFDQIIWEFGNDKCPDWIHISYVSKEKNRHQILKARKVAGKTTYTRIRG